MTPEERRYAVTGMTCAHCELSVVEEVAEVPGVESVTADHLTGLLLVRGAAVEDASVAAAVAEAGYQVHAGA